MSKPSLADVLASIKTLTTEMTAMKADIAILKDQPRPSAASNDDRRSEDLRDIDLPPRPKKWDFPRFDGTTDPLLFLNKFEAYFRHHRTMAEERVGMASYHLDDVAQLWYTQLLEEDGAPTWGRFKELLNLRFGPPLRSAPLFELSECRRTGTVEEYSNRFQDLLPRAGRLDEAQRVQHFTGGLLPPLSHVVRIHHPETLAAAMSFARQVELMEHDRPAQHQPRLPQRGAPPPATPRAALPAPTPLLALPAPPAAAQQGRGEGNPRRLTRRRWPNAAVSVCASTATRSSPTATIGSAAGYSSSTAWRLMRTGMRALPQRTLLGIRRRLFSPCMPSLASPSRTQSNSR